MKASSSNSFDNDKERLKQILSDFRYLISSVLEEGKDNKGEFLFVKELFPFIKNAWKYVEGNFDDVFDRLKKVEEDKLTQHGLTGAQLEFKEKIIRWIKDKFKKVGGKSLFRRLLDTIEPILDSIMSAIGAGGAIREFKESMKNSIDD